MKHMTIVMDAVGYMGLRGLLYGAGLGAAYGTILSPIAGTIYGAFYGAIVGLPLGNVGGIIISLITVRFFNPQTDSLNFYQKITALGGVTGLVGSLFGFALLLGPSLIFSIIPSVIAAGCAVYVSHNYATRCLPEMQSKPEDNPQAGATAHG
jgi:hypothetical protein